MFEKIKSFFFGDVGRIILEIALFIGVFFLITPFLPERQQPPALKSFGDGIQNHLTWSIKGECFFVRPHTDETVYLIRVADCDKK
jgi:hypothetical protein